MSDQMIRFLNAEDIKKCIRMADVIRVIKDAFIQLSAGSAVVPLRMQMDLPEQKATEFFMPAYLSRNKKVGLKIVSLNKNNPQNGLPLIHALVLLLDGKTGQPLSVMDGGYLTALRTGAASGLATDLLARRDAKVLLIFGAGVQGRSQLQAVSCVRNLQQVFVVDRKPEKAKEFSSEISKELKIPVESSGWEQVIGEADVICTATTSAEPLFPDERLKPGVHINAVGAYKPHFREIPPETVKRAKVVVDSREACLREAGDLILPLQGGVISKNHIFAEIGEIAAGKKSGRTSDSEITIFKSVGNAVQDLAAADEILKRAKKMDVGKILDL